MEAVIKDGGRQYTVHEGDTIQVDLKDIEPGKAVEFADVLLVRDGEEVKVGTPTVSGAKVVGKVRAHVRDKKVMVLRLRRRKSSRTRKGHRQPLTEVEIQEIVSG